MVLPPGAGQRAHCSEDGKASAAFADYELAARARAGRTVMSLDWRRIAEWTTCIIEDDLAPIGEVFAAAGADMPEAIWNPSPEQMTAAPLRFLIGHWHELIRGGTRPHTRAVDPQKLRPVLGYLTLLDAVDDGRDFRYRLYGSIVAEISNLDLTGKLLSELPGSAHATEFAIAASRATLRRSAPLYTTRKPALAEASSRWRRIALPLVDDADVPVRLLIGTVASGLDGRTVSG